MYIGNKIGIVPGNCNMSAKNANYINSIELNSFSGDEKIDSTSWSLSHTTSGLDTFLITWIHSTEPTETITAVAYNSVPMTQFAVMEDPNADGYLYGYKLLNPTIGTYNIVATFDASSSGAIAGVSMSGVNGYTQIDTAATDSGTGLTFSIETVTANDNEQLLAFTVDSSGTSIASTNTTELTNFDNALIQKCWSSTTVVAEAGATSLNFSNDISSNWAGIIVSIIPIST